MLGRKKTITLIAQGNQKSCQLGNVTLGSNTDLNSKKKPGIPAPFNITPQKMMKVLGGSCTSTFSLCDSQRPGAGADNTWPSSATHIWRAISTKLDHRHPWAHSSWLVSWCPPSRSIWLQAPSIHGHFMHSCYHQSALEMHFSNQNWKVH